MADKITNIKERILYFAKYKGITYEVFFSLIGMTYGSFKGKCKNTPINSDALTVLITKFPELSSEWILTGDGPMLKTENSVNPLTEMESRLWNLVESQQKIIEGQTRTIEGQQRTIETLAKKGGAEDAGGAVSGAALG